MIYDSTACSDENVDASPELVSLVFNVGASVDCQNIVFTVILLEGVQFFRDLEGKLSCWGQNHGHRLALAKSAFSSETRNHGQTKAKSLS